MTNEERERLLREAIAARIAEGWTLRPWTTYDPTGKCCCPLGALAGPGDPLGSYLGLRSFAFFDRAQKLLACEGAYISGIANGFDGVTRGTGDPVAHALGAQLRKEFAPGAGDGDEHG